MKIALKIVSLMGDEGTNKKYSWVAGYYTLGCSSFSCTDMHETLREVQRVFGNHAEVGLRRYVFAASTLVTT